ncbi:hypothetical protein QYE76_020511 [Lolium multiflorum]|uniref:Berberine/berberine-like domain-containing protein n=1 Tax=Lolium multiflorum TaxID=4521 RepID=A0AAD8R7V8_LOLMU|nr:hypothetical protein QYE76_020508 [Lolium multiflorum]KAK1614994.1 hypothetical protein QYE76_020511 [Lolium multiflorum]
MHVPAEPREVDVAEINYCKSNGLLRACMHRELRPIDAAEQGNHTGTCLFETDLESTALSNVGTPEEVLLNRTSGLDISAEGKSDYVRRPISKDAWNDIFSWFGSGLIMLEPHGGFIGSVPNATTPYPHRDGVLYVIQYLVFWPGANGATPQTWLHDFYDFMGQHVTANPREAYVNFRDLDIGQNAVVDDVSTFESGQVWGERYFMGNFRRLAMVKAQVDPTDYFRNEQTTPPLLHRRN